MSNYPVSNSNSLTSSTRIPGEGFSSGLLCNSQQITESNSGGKNLGFSQNGKPLNAECATKPFSSLMRSTRVPGYDFDALMRSKGIPKKDPVDYDFEGTRIDYKKAKKKVFLI